MSNNERYQVVVRACQAPSSGGGKFRRPKVIYVVDSQVQDPAKPVRSYVRCWHNVDGRYDGPKSAYGQALSAARMLSQNLTASDLHQNF
jgi:hypothetical protein